MIASEKRRVSNTLNLTVAPYVLLLVAGHFSAMTATAQNAWTVTPKVPSLQQLYPQGAVRLLDGPFKDAQEEDHAYLVRLEPDRLLAQFRVEAGLQPKAKPYGGWEAPAKPGTTSSLAGHTTGHYLSALSLMYRVTDDYRLKDRVTYISKELKECQDKRGDGSLVAFPYERELEADIRAGKVETIDKYWAPFYTIHKEMAGLRDAWVWCGDTNARAILVGMADWCGGLVKNLTDERRERLLSMEHGGMAEVLADVYAITGDDKYLGYARLFCHHEVMDPAANGIDDLTGKHANTQIPKFIGYQRIHELSGDQQTGAAARFFWNTVVSNRTWVNGGNSMDEHFPDPKSMGDAITNDGGPETCNTYNMLKLTAALYREKPSTALLDYYENALFNQVLPSEAPLTGAGAFVYYTPLRPGFARSYSTDFNSFWCCTGTGMENHARYGEMIYTHDAATVSVNLFIASELSWPEQGFALRQDTRFPEESVSALTVTAAPATDMTLRIRHPGWLAAKKLALLVNGKSVNVPSQPGGFAEITRRWKAGDRVEIQLPMRLHIVRQWQCPCWFSLFYGPILLAQQLGDAGLSQSDFIGPYTPAKALLPLPEVPKLLGTKDEEILSRITPVPGQPLTFRAPVSFTSQPNGVPKAIADFQIEANHPGLPESYIVYIPIFRVHFQRYAIYSQSIPNP